MLVTILAVTKAYDRFCIAGLNEDGQWVRPMPNDPSSSDPQSRFWTREQLKRDSGIFVKPGDVWNVNGRKPTRFLHANHVEDYVVTQRRFHHSLTNNQLLQFLRTHVEDEIAFTNTVFGYGRSLCLVKVLSFKTEVFEYQGKEDPKIYLTGINFSLDNPHVKFKNYKLKDCKWAGLVLQGYSSSFNKAFACIGLATQFNGKEYPQLIGLHTSPEAPFSSTYPDED